MVSANVYFIPIWSTSHSFNFIENELVFISADKKTICSSNKPYRVTVIIPSIYFTGIMQTLVDHIKDFITVQMLSLLKIFKDTYERSTFLLFRTVQLQIYLTFSYHKQTDSNFYSFSPNLNRPNYGF